MGNVSASEDTQRYLDGYPDQEDDPSQDKNVRFYRNEIASTPDGGLIDDIHANWFGNYYRLEAHHGYIQWLFPIREHGLNASAQRLHLHEAKTIAADPKLQDRIIKSYELMLDFYGMKLTDRAVGTIERADHFADRYEHLNHSFHNYLRITRILKCLGEVGLEHMKIHFVEFVLKEVCENGKLANCYESCVKYWAPVLKNQDERERVIKYVQEHEPPKRQFYY